MEQVPGLVEVLTLLASGVGVGTVIAFLFEHIGWFQKMEPKTKWWVVFGLSLGLPIGAQVLLQFVPASVWEQLQPYWFALAAGFLSWAGSQLAHLAHKRLAG